MATNQWLLLNFYFFLSTGQAKRYIISRHHHGDIYSLQNKKCDKNFCYDKGNNAASIPWANCQCQCLPSTPVFRQDIDKCVRTITECGERMAMFIGPAFTEIIPFVTLSTEKDSILYPSAEISLIDPSLQVVGLNLCILKDFKLLDENGWKEIEKLDTHTSPTFKAFGERGKLFLQFSGDRNIRKLMSNGLVTVDVACKQENPIISDIRSVESNYCIVFRVDNSFNLILETQNVSFRINYYVVIGLFIGLLGVMYIVVTFVCLLLRKKMKEEERKKLELPFEERNDTDNESQYEIIKHEEIDQNNLDNNENRVYHLKKYLEHRIK